MRTGPKYYSSDFMKFIYYALLFAGVCLSLHGCVYLAAPGATAAIGAAGLAIKGAELQSQVRQADTQDAIDESFETTWNASIAALLDLGIEVTSSKKEQDGHGGLVEGKTKDMKVKVVIVRFTEKISEFGITVAYPGCFWPSHDKALAKLIARKIMQKAKESKIQN